MISRRELLQYTCQATLAAGFAPSLIAMTPAAKGSVRCINIINFIRGVEPRGPVDLLLPVQKQMESVLEHGLPATWLLQFDALVSGPFVEYLKSHMAKSHEVGFWFEMNEMHCKEAGVAWRGRPGYEWDHYPFVAFTIGYTPEERIKLADAAMRKFKEVWGKYPSSVASWNLDSITMAHLAEKYGVDAFAVCRDQIATDGFTIWGAPFAGYYPSKVNCWSPALDRKNQISAPVFKMLGQDPVYYYDRAYKLPPNRRVGSPDTMEPVWPSGRSPVFIKRFLEMISDAPTLAFAYAQLGQENSFGWPEMSEAFPVQMKALQELQQRGVVHIETMGESGRRFKKSFKSTPTQAQVMLEDPFGDTEKPEGSIWFQSRFYRANLHLKGNLPFLRDLTVYSDQNPQPFLDQPTKAHDVEQRMPAILDGFHWSKHPGSFEEKGAGGYFLIDGKEAHLTGKPTIRESGANLFVDLPFEGCRVNVHFLETTVEIHAEKEITLSFEWDPTKAPLTKVTPNQIFYHWLNLDYSATLQGASAELTPTGWRTSGKSIQLRLSQ